MWLNRFGLAERWDTSGCQASQERCQADPVLGVGGFTEEFRKGFEEELSGCARRPAEGFCLEGIELKESGLDVGLGEEDGGVDGGEIDGAGEGENVVAGFDVFAQGDAVGEWKRCDIGGGHDKRITETVNQVNTEYRFMFGLLKLFDWCFLD